MSNLEKLINRWYGYKLHFKFITFTVGLVDNDTEM